MITTTEKKPLTGWLILFMLILGLGSYSQISKEITGVRQTFEPHFSEFPSLRPAVLTYQSLLLGAVCAAFFTIWVLLQRTPRTLSIAKRSFIICIALRIMAPWIFHFHSGLPPETLGSLESYLSGTLSLAIFGTIWYLYLTKSQRVAELYAK